MLKNAVILAVLIAGQCLGQSGAFNPLYAPVLKLEIPYVPPRDVLITNGTVQAHPEAGFEYTDFVLQCIDQTGERGTWNDYGWFTQEWVEEGYWDESDPESPVWVDTSHFVDVWQPDIQYDSVLWAYDSRQAAAYEAADNNAVCHFTDATGQRTAHNWMAVTNVTTITNTVYVNDGIDWNGVISAGNYPDIVMAYDSASAGPFPLFVEENSNPDNPLGIIYRSLDNWTYVYSTTAQSDWRLLRPSGSLPPYYGNYTFEINNKSVHALNPDITLSIWGAISSNTTFNTTNILSGGTIRVQSGGEAYAIEVYPSKTHPNFKNFKQWDSGVRWVAKLHNGSNFYSNAETGDPVLFEVRKEWIQKIP